MTWLDRQVGDLANAAVRLTQHARAFMAALCVVLLWGGTGPIFAFSDTWQLVINTGTTIVTFLLGFLTQHALSLKHADHTDQLEQHIARLEAKLDQALAVLVLLNPQVTSGQLDQLTIEAFAGAADISL